MLNPYLAQIPRGEVQTVLCGDVIEAIAQLEQYEGDSAVEGKVVAQTWEQLPDHEALLAEILYLLAEAALALWPMWYGQEKGIDSLNPVDIPLNLGELGATRQTVLIPWLKSAMGFCQAGKLPVLKRFSRTVQVSQLALAISPNDLAIALGVSERRPSESKLLSLAGAATWLAKETKARVVVLISEALAEQKALDAILYGAIRPSALELIKIAETTAGESKHIVWPLQGKPHPLSPGEQLLAKKLSQDAELSSLFYFNHTVETVHGQKYLVDLLWPEGKIVVEIDGYRHHGNAFAFIRDRQRDYELLISGYLVLRLAHDEVVNDVEIAVEKICDVVRFRLNSTIFKSEVQS